ncbi:MAG UNVERIFIED_CONTAM: MBL fold metallo-hydrolase [Planctomycetaceae bacterium]|jgi:phosphoribosyl 1,2-cyclic phosphate phosphodiesterase
MLEYAILTHDHADHIGGIDELRVFSRAKGAPLPIYSDSRTIDIVSQRFSYLVNEGHIKFIKLEDFETEITLS